MKTKLLAHAAFIMAASLSTGLAVRANTVYGLSADYSTTSNPNGVWAFGYENTFGGALNDYVQVSHTPIFAVFDFWGAPSVPGFNPFYVPSVFFNPTASAVVDAGGIELNSQEVAFHPGEFGEYSVIQFTAPTSGDYLVDYEFASADTRTGGETTAYITANGSTLVSQSIASPITNVGGNTQLGPISLAAGEDLDFVVGQRNGQFFYDATGIAANVTLCSTQPCSGAPVPTTPGSVGSVLIGSPVGPAPMPEPATWAVMIVGLLGVGGALRQARAKRLARTSRASIPGLPALRS